MVSRKFCRQVYTADDVLALAFSLVLPHLLCEQVQECVMDHDTWPLFCNAVGMFWLGRGTGIKDAV
jgi:hypothetical protein